MTDTGGPVSTVTSLAKLVVSFIYRLTVRLTVELLKFGLLSVILLGVSALVGLGYVAFIYWAYTTYEGSIPAAVCAAVFGVAAVLLVAKMVEFIVKDVLRLTDLPLSELIGLFLKGVVGSKGKSGKTKEGSSSVSSSSDEHVKKTT